MALREKGGNMSTRSILKSLSRGKWDRIIIYSAPDLKKAVKNRPLHVPCPIHGGIDGLRAFNDFDDTGGMVCNTCGAFSDGFKVLKWCYDINNQQAEDLVRHALHEIDHHPGLLDE